MIAFIDVLGFKGIWKRNPNPSGVLTTLEEVRRIATDLKLKQNEEDAGELWKNLSLDIRMFSDTLVVCCHLPEGCLKSDLFYECLRRYMLLRYVILILSNLIGSAATNALPLLYRGAVATGEFIANDFALLGPAVDEAGSFFEIAEGAFVFLCPSATDTFEHRPFPLSKALFPYFLPYKIPLKEKQALSTYAVNPLLSIPREDRSKTASKLIRTFGEPSEIPAHLFGKFENTKVFLAHAEKCLPETW